MALRVLASVALVLLGSAMNAPVVLLLGLVTLSLDVVHAIWARRGLSSVTYRRALPVRHAAFGDPVALDIEVHNRGAIPISWLRADDAVSPSMDVADHELADGDEPGSSVLRNVWTLRPWERVRRRYRLLPDRRGVYTVGPVDLAAGDPFARQCATGHVDDEASFLVWPRTVPVVELEPAARPGDIERHLGGLEEDPSRFAGVRPYAPGDQLRRLHARTSARLGEPMVKRFEPSREREILIALDVQAHEGPAWDAGWGGDDVEHLYVVAASIARSLATRHVPFGLLAGGWAGAETRLAAIPASSAPGQVERVLDLLARLSGHASMPFERVLLAAAATARPGTTVLVVTARDPRPFVAAMRRVEARGAAVVVVACGQDPATAVASARRAGLAARRAVTDGHWRTAASLVLAR
jgi:uncharacterized protein (DUF58 family)